ncbi:MAG TPA: LuxR C-terminal-related transcriptional regulator, partial [Miltoncostaeaceae bacterium]|nr:LuxR C-terminal-related transcriptional regulator [Miltoncostaeaceae bacterium]
CDAVTGREGSASVLTDLERSNMFLVPLDSRRGWYRYHHLFGELLRHELTLEHPAEVPELHRRASRWFESQGDMDEAIHHAHAAGDLDRAADLIAGCWAGYERSGWTATTQRWLSLLPDPVVRADPRLCLAAALIAINLGRGASAAPWLDAAERAAGTPGAPGDARAIASDVASGRSLVALLAGDAPAAVAIGRDALALSEGVPPWSRSIACLALGIALHGAAEREAAYPYLEEVVELSGMSQAPAVVALSHLADTDLDRGDVALAERRAQRAIDLASQERHAEYPHAAGAHAALARARALRGDHGAAREYADRAVDLARRGHSRPETAHAILVRAMVRVAAGHQDAARRDVEEARAMLDGAVGARNLLRMMAVVEEQLDGPAPQAATGGDLTDRELAVLRRLTGDGSAREIAADLYVSHNTVKTQMRAIYRKLGVATREDAVAAARERGLLPRSLSG